MLGCGSGVVPARNVVLVVADTLRADHLGAYGYGRDVSPNLDAFATTATRYTRAIASSPWTLPSHASLFTGRDPWEHGAHLVPIKGAQAGNVRPLQEDSRTLAEVLRDAGFATAGFGANTAFLAPWLRLDQGFEVWEIRREPALARVPTIRAWLEAHREGPFFLFVNFMDTHRPYNTKPRPGLLDPPAERGDLLGELIRTTLPGTGPAPEALVRRVIDQYDTAIAHVDEGIGALLDALRELDLFDASLVVVTSDHGEFFGEHQLVEHSKDVYQEVLAVPLLVKAAGQRRGAVVDTLVSSTHVAHLIASGLPEAISEGMRAQFPRAPGETRVLAESHFGHAKDAADLRWGRRFRRARRAVYAWPHKLIHSSDGAHELYDLEADPRERRNRAERDPARVADLAGFLASREAEKRLPRGQEAPAPEVLEELRALGYVD